MGNWNGWKIEQQVRKQASTTNVCGFGRGNQREIQQELLLTLHRQYLPDMFHSKHVQTGTFQLVISFVTSVITCGCGITFTSMVAFCHWPPFHLSSLRRAGTNTRADVGLG